MVISDSMAIALAVGSWAIWVTHSLGRNSDETSSLIRAGSIGSQLRRLGLQLLGAFVSIFTIICLVIFSIVTGTNRGISWSRYALSPQLGSVDSSSSVHFAESFRNPLVACLAVLLIALITFYLASLFCLQIWIRGHSITAITTLISWVTWSFMCSIMPIPIPPILDSTLTFDLGWSLTPEKGFGWTTFGLAILIGLNVSVGSLLNSKLNARQLLGSRLFTLLAQLGLLLLASRSVFSMEKNSHDDLAGIYFSSVNGDLTQYLLMSLVPLTGVSAYVARMDNPFSTSELMRFGSYRRWQLRSLFREFTWMLPTLAITPIVFWFATGKAFDVAHIDKFALPYFGFITLYLFEILVAASLKWLDLVITYSWPIVAASFIAFGYFSPFGSAPVNIFSPFALSGDGFDHGEALSAPLSAVLSVVLFSFIVVRAKPKFAQNLI